MGTIIWFKDTRNFIISSDSFSPANNQGENSTFITGCVDCAVLCLDLSFSDTTRIPFHWIGN